MNNLNFRKSHSVLRLWRRDSKVKDVFRQVWFAVGSQVGLYVKVVDPIKVAIGQ